MTKSPRTSKSHAFGIRLSDAAMSKLRADAARRGMSISAYLEDLVMQGLLTHTDYFAQQAAVNSFITVGLSASIAAKVLGVAETRALQEKGATLAAQMFGEPRVRPGAIGETPDGFEDPRVLALFEAFCPR